jgi:hypothetical protein
MTPFETVLQRLEAGAIIGPTVSHGAEKINAVAYQLAVSHFNLKIMASGMTCRGVKLKDLKHFYGLKGKSAKDCLVQFKVIRNAYNQKHTAVNN